MESFGSICDGLLRVSGASSASGEALRAAWRVSNVEACFACFDDVAAQAAACAEMSGDAGRTTGFGLVEAANCFGKCGGRSLLVVVKVAAALTGLDLDEGFVGMFVAVKESAALRLALAEAAVEDGDEEVLVALLQNATREEQELVQVALLYGKEAVTKNRSQFVLDSLFPVALHLTERVGEDFIESIIMALQWDASVLVGLFVACSSNAEIGKACFKTILQAPDFGNLVQTSLTSKEKLFDQGRFLVRFAAQFSEDMKWSSYLRILEAVQQINVHWIQTAWPVFNSLVLSAETDMDWAWVKVLLQLIFQHQSIASRKHAAKMMLSPEANESCIRAPPSLIFDVLIPGLDQKDLFRVVIQDVGGPNFQTGSHLHTRRNFRNLIGQYLKMHDSKKVHGEFLKSIHRYASIQNLSFFLMLVETLRDIEPPSTGRWMDSSHIDMLINLTRDQLQQVMRSDTVRCRCAYSLICIRDAFLQHADPSSEGFERASIAFAVQMEINGASAEPLEQWLSSVEVSFRKGIMTKRIPGKRFFKTLTPMFFDRK